MVRIFLLLSFVISINSISFAQEKTKKSKEKKQKISIGIKTNLGAMSFSKYKLIGEIIFKENYSLELEGGILRKYDNFWEEHEHKGIFSSIRFKQYFKDKKFRKRYISVGLGLENIDHSSFGRNRRNRVYFVSFIDRGTQWKYKMFLMDIFVGIGFTNNINSGEFSGLYSVLLPNLAFRIGLRTGLQF